MQRINRLVSITSIAILIYELTIQKSDAREVDWEQEVDWGGICEVFSPTLSCQQMPPQIVKIRLDRSGEDDEWIRIQKSGTAVTLLHTTRVENEFVSGLFDTVLRLAPIPALVSPKQHGWSDHSTIRVTFKPDSCSESQATSSPDCTVTGTNMVILPRGTDILMGTFTIEYQENELLRSVTFRIPVEEEDD